jgi:hypothetical protein
MYGQNLSQMQKMRNRLGISKLTKTRDFEKLDQLTSFMVQHLYGLYDELENVVEFSNDWDFLQGSIETTQVYLHKSGTEYLDHTAYIEKVDGAKWTAI